MDNCVIIEWNVRGRFSASHQYLETTLSALLPFPFLRLPPYSQKTFYFTINWVYMYSFRTLHKHLTRISFPRQYIVSPGTLQSKKAMVGSAMLTRNTLIATRTYATMASDTKSYKFMHSMYTKDISKSCTPADSCIGFESRIHRNQVRAMNTLT